MDSPLVVKVLSGPHTGAEMEIPEEGVVVGRGDECDLILFDLQMAPRHFHLVANPLQGLILQPLEGSILLDGVPIEGATVLGNNIQIITAGSTHLAAGRTNQDWPTVNLAEESEDSQGSSDIDMPLEIEASTSERKIPLKKTVIVALLVLFIGGASCLYWEISKKWRKPQVREPSIAQHPNFFEKFTSLRKSSSMKSPIPQPFHQRTLPPEVQVVLELSKNLSNVVFSLNDDGRRKQFDVWVRGENAATAARRVLNQVSPPLLYSIVDLAQIEASANTLSQLSGLSLRVCVEPEGIAFWRGYLQNDQNWQDFFPHALRELPAIRDNRCEIIFGNQLVKKLQDELRQQGFGGEVRPVASESGLFLEGFLPKEKKEKWNFWIAQVREKYVAQVSIFDRVGIGVIAEKTPSKDFFSSKVVGVSGAAIPWVSLADGSKLFPGAKLKKGYILEGITSTTLLLNGPDGAFKLSLSTLN